MKINEFSYNATGARYGYNGTHEQDLEVNADGNYVDFGNFGYDTRVAMRRNQEPMRAYLTSLSPYSIFNSNPIMYKDPTGLFHFTEHVAIDRDAYTIFNSMNLGRNYSLFLKVKKSFEHNFYVDVFGAYDRHLHLDNYSNAEMQSVLMGENFLNLDKHTLQDFYCHTNYIEIMYELGFDKENMLPFEKLDKYYQKQVMKKIKGTNNNTEIPVLGWLWDGFVAHKSNGEDDHNPTDGFKFWVDTNINDDIKKHWGNSEYFTSKHNFPAPIGTHPSFELGMGLATGSTVSAIANENNMQWITDSPLAPGHYEKVK